jgi:hypothetical protein
MAITRPGAANTSTSDSVTLPAHQAGDMILVTVRGTNTITPPAAGGTVPDWAAGMIQNGVANTLALATSAVIATANNHTSGTWTNALHMIAAVFRGDAGTLSIGASATKNGDAVQVVIYPALALQAGGGTSYGVRCGCRGIGDFDIATAPSGAQAWSMIHRVPGSPTTVLAMHEAAALVANPTEDTVATAGSNSFYRAHTIEILETIADIVNSRLVGCGFSGIIGG